MSRQLARLGTLGLVSRRPDPDDYRGQLLELTDEGQRRFETAQQARRAFLRHALSGWSETDIDGVGRAARPAQRGPRGGPPGALSDRQHDSAARSEGPGGACRVVR